MKQYIPHVLLVIGILIFANGFVMFVYSGAAIAAIVPIVGATMAIHGFLRLRSR